MASSFRIWSISTGILSRQLALFIVMLPKANWTSHSRMSGSGWMITPSWLSGSWSYFFVQFFRIFFPTLLNIFCFCQVYTISVLYWAHLCMKCFLGTCNFLEEISCIYNFIIPLYFFALITEEGFLISPCYSLEFCIQIGISLLFSFAFHFSSQLFVTTFICSCFLILIYFLF